MTASSSSNARRSVRTWAALALLGVLLACGGGVGTGGTGDSPAVVSGPITGFGSVIVAGREFDDAAAVVLDDTGAAVARDGSELRLGMTVSIEGTTDGSTAIAETVRIETALVGPVEAVDARADTFSVSGQAVRVDAATVFDASIPARLASLRAGDAVRVFGLQDGTDGGHVATRVERAPADAVHRVTGNIAALDTVARTFRVGGTQFFYGPLVAPAGLANGQLVSLRASGALEPFQVIGFDRIGNPPSAGRHTEVEGIVSALAGARFVVGGITVDASQARVDPAPSALQEGVRVEVDGRIDAGILVAQRVKVFEAEALDYRLEGPVTALDTAARTFTVRRTTVDYADASFIGGTASQLARGVKVRAEGPMSEDGTRLHATRIEFR